MNCNAFSHVVVTEKEEKKKRKKPLTFLNERKPKARSKNAPKPIQTSTAQENSVKEEMDEGKSELESVNQQKKQRKKKKGTISKKKLKVKSFPVVKDTKIAQNPHKQRSVVESCC
jgi:hypothetical protein